MNESKTLYDRKITLKEAEALIANGADPNEVNCSGFTPISQSIDNDRIDLLKFLMAKGAKIDYFDPSQLNPFIRAVCLDRLEIVEFFIDNNKDTSAQTTALYLRGLDYSNFVCRPQTIKLIEDGLVKVANRS